MTVRDLFTMIAFLAGFTLLIAISLIKLWKKVNECLFFNTNDPDAMRTALKQGATIEDLKRLFPYIDSETLTDILIDYHTKNKPNH